MTGEQVENYITTQLECKPRYDCEALANAINDIAEEVEFDSFRLMQLLLENKPIDMLYTHSYGFHTNVGRNLIESMQNKYYEYESAS